MEVCSCVPLREWRWLEAWVTGPAVALSDLHGDCARLMSPRAFPDREGEPPAQDKDLPAIMGTPCPSYFV